MSDLCIAHTFRPTRHLGSSAATCHKKVGQPAGSAPCRRPNIDNVSQRPEPRGSDWNRNGLLHGSHSHAGTKPFTASGRGRQANAFSVARHSPPASTGRCSTSPSPEPVMTSHLSCARRNEFKLTPKSKVRIRKVSFVWKQGVD